MITIVIPISRRDYLRPVFQCLDQLERPDDTELLIMVDGDKDLQMAVDKRVDTIHYKKIRVETFGDKPAKTINERRFRIAAIHNQAKELISPETNFVFLVEDDTVYPSDALKKMSEYLITRDCSYVEGIQLGRHITHYIGGWQVDDLENPKVVRSIMPAEDMQFEPITAGGLYCCLVEADLYRNHEFKPFDTDGRVGLSCDFNFGLEISRAGRHCVADWSIQCDHIGERGSVNLGNATPVQVIFEKDRKNKWNGRTVVK